MFTNRHQSGAIVAASQTAKSRTENKANSGADFQDGDDKRGSGKNDINKKQKDETMNAQKDRRKRTSASAARAQNTNQDYGGKKRNSSVNGRTTGNSKVSNAKQGLIKDCVRPKKSKKSEQMQNDEGFNKNENQDGDEEATEGEGGKKEKKNGNSEKEEETGVKSLKARNLHVALDSVRKDRTKVTIEEGKTEQLLKEQRDREDFGRGFDELRYRKTPIYKEDIHSPYVYPDLVYHTDKVKERVLHGEFLIAQPQKQGAIKWWKEKYECIGEMLPPEPNGDKKVSQVVKPKPPKRDFRIDRSEVDKLGDPEKLTYAHIGKIRECKERILKKFDNEWRKNRQSELDAAWEESGIDYVKSPRLRESFKSTFDVYMHDPRNPKPKRKSEESEADAKKSPSKNGKKSKKAGKAKSRKNEEDGDGAGPEDNENRGEEDNGNREAEKTNDREGRRDGGRQEDENNSENRTEASEENEMTSRDVDESEGEEDVAAGQEAMQAQDPEAMSESIAVEEEAASEAATAVEASEMTEATTNANREEDDSFAGDDDGFFGDNDEDDDEDDDAEE